MSFHTIVPAGGIGSRLWPLSRAARPKFLLDLGGEGASLLQRTVARLAPFAMSQTVVTGAAHAAAVREQVPTADILVEPSMRGTMPAIALAAELVRRRDPEAVVGSFAADHHIRDERAFGAALGSAIGAAEAGYVATIGIAPDSPSTAYGYIHAGNRLSAVAGIGEASGTGPVFDVREFVEKPDSARAARYLETGEFLWNAGIFVARASVLMEALERYHPEIAGPVRELAARWGDATSRAEAIEAFWKPLPVAVIDRAVAEPLSEDGGVVVVPADMGWSDVGDYESLARLLADAKGPRIAVDSPGSLSLASKPVAVVGIEGAVVVEMDDVVLVTTREAAQKVKEAREEAREAGLGSLL